MLVLRENTERPEGVATATVRLVGTREDMIVAEATRLPTDAQAYRRMSEAADAYRVRLAVGCFNEAAIVENNLRTLCSYMSTLEPGYDWEIVFIDDGSSDNTGAMAERVAADYPQVSVLYHPSNFGLGQALRFAFANCRGDDVVVLDVDLSYGPEHIPLLVSKMVATGAKVVASSPYMAGGKIANVPWFRKAPIHSGASILRAQRKRCSTL